MIYTPLGPNKRRIEGYLLHLADFVQVLQKVLQLYAGFVLCSEGQSGVEAQLDEIIAADVESWPTLIKSAMASDSMSEAAFSEALQRRMEGTILKLKSGSYAQQVQVRSPLTAPAMEALSARSMA